MPLSACWRRCVVDPRNTNVWEELLRLHGRDLQQIVKKVASQRDFAQSEDIDDIMQEVYLKLSQKARSGAIVTADDGPSLEAYLKALVANTARDYLNAKNAQRRDVGRTTSLDNPVLQQTLHGPCGAEEMDRHLQVGELEELFARNKKQWLVYQFYFIQRWTAKEIASLKSLELTEKGVESQIRRMRDEARGEMGKVAEGNPKGGPS